MSGRPWTNWSRTARANPVRVERPADAAEVRALVRGALERGERVRPVGNRFSASGIAAAPEVALDMTGLRGMVRVDPEARTATFLPGTTLGEAMAALEDVDLAFANPTRNIDVTLGGVVSTGGHGWGRGYGTISSQLVEVELVTGAGERLRVSERRNGELWPAVRIGLGALGVLTELTFRVVPAYSAVVTERLESFRGYLESFERTMASADHVAATWRPHTGRVAISRGTRQEAQATGAVRPGVVAASGADFWSSMRIGLAKAFPGAVPTMNRLSNVLHTATTRRGAPAAALATRPKVPNATLEYALPVGRVASAMLELDEAMARRRLSVPSEVLLTTTAPDDAYLATSYGRRVGNIAVRMPSSMDPGEYFSVAEEIFIAHEGLPNWSSAHTLRAEEIAYVLPRFGDFLEVRHRLDPELVFTNGHLRRVLGE